MKYENLGPKPMKWRCKNCNAINLELSCICHNCDKVSSEQAFITNANTIQNMTLPFLSNIEINKEAKSIPMAIEELRWKFEYEKWRSLCDDMAAAFKFLDPYSDTDIHDIMDYWQHQVKDIMDRYDVFKDIINQYYAALKDTND